MDRLNQLRGEAGGSKDSTLDTTSPPSEGYMTANESTSKYYSLSEDDSTFDISTIKDVSLATTATAESDESISNPDELMPNLSPIGKKGDVLDYKIGKQIEAANILSGGVDIFDDNENSYDGDELVIDDNADDEKSNPELKHGESLSMDMESPLIGEEADIGSKDTEVVLQIDGKNVDAIDIGNGLYLYRKEGEEELAAVQIIDDDQHQPSFKFLKVRENAEGNLEVYEEIEIEVPKEVPVKEGKATDKKTSSHVPIKDINKVISESASIKNVERKIQTPQKEPTSTYTEVEPDAIKDTSVENKSDGNFNGKMMKFTDSRKSPVIGSYTPMTYHSTPNKEGKPLTKTMVDQQLHPSRHSDNVKKTIEVHTDSSKQRASEPHIKYKDIEDNKVTEVGTTDKEIVYDETIEKVTPIIEEKDLEKAELMNIDDVEVTSDIPNEIKPSDQIASEEVIVTTEEDKSNDPNVSMNVDVVTDVVVPIDVQEVTKDLQTAKDAVSIDKLNMKTVKTEEKVVDATSKEPPKLEPETSKVRLTIDVPSITDIKKDNITVNDSVVEPSKNKEFNSNLQKNISSSKSKITEEKSSQDVKMSNINDSVKVMKETTKKEASPTKASMSFVTDNNKSKPNESSVKTEGSVSLKAVIDETIVLDDKLTTLDKQDTEIKMIVTSKKIEEKVEYKPIKEKTEIKKIEEKTNSKRLVEKQTGLNTTANVAAVKGIDESKKVILSGIKIPEKPIKAPKSEPNLNQVKKDDKNTPIEVNKNIDVKEKNITSVDKGPVNKTQGKVQSVQAVKSTPFINERLEKKAAIAPPEPLKPVIAEKIKTTKVEPTVPKLEPAKIVTPNMPFKHEAGSSSIDKKATDQSTTKKIEPRDLKDIPNIIAEPKPINNNHAAVPFGKWTDANRQEFLNKFKAKVPAASSNGNQIKNSNDLNRRDVLKKIDSQRQSSNALSKTQEANKLASKNETAFSKTNVIPQESKIPVKSEAQEIKVKPVADKPIAKQEKPNKSQAVSQSTKTVSSNDTKKEAKKRTEVNYQDLIDKTIEDMLHRGAPTKSQDEVNQNASEETSAEPKNTNSYPQNYPPIDEVATLDAIEMKMNELHGIPFIERPPHELPQVQKSELKANSKPEKEKQLSSNKTTKLPNPAPLPIKTQQKIVKENVMEVDSEEEIIEHEPITGDLEINKKSPVTKPSSTGVLSSESTEKLAAEAPKKEAIITEKDFDKFARRNSITYENCITVNFDGKEPHNVIKTIVEKDAVPKSYSRSDLSRVDNKAKVPNKYQNVRQNTHTSKLQPANKFEQVNDESSNRNQSKLQKAYHSALTAKRQMECPITIIEDKPVKVVFMENVEYIPSQLNVQGQELSPIKKSAAEPDVTIATVDSLDSDILDAVDDAKSQDEVKVKTKHQRKQVLTPVEEPELELIEPTDLGIELSPKKKRKPDDEKGDKTLKYPMRKKMYMLSSSGADEKQANSQDVSKNPLKEAVNRNENVNAPRSSASAIDNLVKAAELLETQTENAISGDSPNPNNQQSTPVKRGRGRPRKYPLPDAATDKSKEPSPQKKPKLIDVKSAKRDTISDEEDSDGEIIKENWTMGKINENIVCPICNKLFRTENVVFKHVKHCTGPSPNRSDSDKRSPRRIRQSQESDDTKSHDSKSDDMDIDDEKLSTLKERKETPKKRKSKDSLAKSDKAEVIIIEDTSDKEGSEKADDRKHHESREQKSKQLFQNNSLVCEFCGKKFRQLSHYVKHRIQQHKGDSKKVEKDVQAPNISVYSCEVCKKEFRKLHHLVQHRIIHNPRSAPVRTLRKSSSEQTESKSETEQSTSKSSDDPSAGFRCEPCDKSFRKLHHLVEHRETHDGINRHKSTTVTPSSPEKPISVHACEICKKTFRKLHHLVEHKEQHMDIESDDKSVKSSLSTKDIIHECSLCYMVFPNEHSLNKHTVICQRKKRQSKQKQAEEAELTEEGIETPKADTEITEDVEPTKPVEKAEEITKNVESKDDDHKKEKVVEEIDLSKDKDDATIEQVIKKESIPSKEVKEKDNPVDQHTNTQPLKRNNVESNKLNAKKDEVPEIPEKIQKVEVKEIGKIRDTPKKKTPLKDKSTPTVTKRPKVPTAPVPVVEDTKPAVESSDDDEVRYMFNPNFKVEEKEEKVFMRVRAKKRSSLQIERPNSKDLVKRRISLQHPPKIPRLKQKSVESTSSTVKNIAKTPKLEPVPSTDSDDSDVKYSFPKTVPEKTRLVPDRTPKVAERQTPRKSIAEKRKTLSAIAKRKSLGKAVTARHKPSPVKQVKRRTLEVEHRCDCGQLFSSAALLSRHTTLAHTPPRIRRRRSPPPDENKPIIKPAPRKSSVADNQTKAKQNAASRKSSVRSDTSTSNTNTKLNKSASKAGKKSIDKDTKSTGEARKSRADKSDATPSAKPRRSGAHRGVPVPEKMRKIMQKNK